MKPFLLFFGIGSTSLPWSVEPVIAYDSVEQAQLAAESRERAGTGNWAKIVSGDSMQVLRTGQHLGVGAGYWWNWTNVISED